MPEIKSFLDEQVKKIAELYKENDELEFNKDDAVLSMKTTMSSDPNALRLIDEAAEDGFDEGQMDLALENAVSLIFHGEIFEAIGESVLALPITKARKVLANAAKTDFDLEDIRENLDSGYGFFGPGMGARRATLIYNTKASTSMGVGKFRANFDPRYKE